MRSILRELEDIQARYEDSRPIGEHPAVVTLAGENDKEGKEADCSNVPPSGQSAAGMDSADGVLFPEEDVDQVDEVQGEDLESCGSSEGVCPPDELEEDDSSIGLISIPESLWEFVRQQVPHNDEVRRLELERQKQRRLHRGLFAVHSISLCSMFLSCTLGSAARAGGETNPFAHYLCTLISLGSSTSVLEFLHAVRLCPTRQTVNAHMNSMSQSMQGVQKEVIQRAAKAAQDGSYVVM